MFEKKKSYKQRYTLSMCVRKETFIFNNGKTFTDCNHPKTVFINKVANKTATSQSKEVNFVLT